MPKPALKKPALKSKPVAKKVRQADLFETPRKTIAKKAEPPPVALPPKKKPNTKPVIKEPYADGLRLCNNCGGEEHKPTKTCAFCLSRDLRPAKKGERPPARMVIAVGRGAWGLGINLEQAIKAMHKNWATFLPKEGQQYQVWDCPRSAFVNGLGHIGWNGTDPKPVCLKVGKL